MNEELKKAYEGIENDLELVEYEGFYNHIKEWNFIKNYITNLQQENARLKDKIDKVTKLMNSELTDVDMGECEEVHISFIKHWLKILKEN